MRARLAFAALVLALSACATSPHGESGFSGPPLVVTAHDPRFNDADQADPEALVRFTAVAIHEERALGCRLAVEAVRAPFGRIEARFEVGIYEGRRIFSVVVAADDLNAAGQTTPHDPRLLSFRAYGEREPELLTISLEGTEPPRGYKALFRRPAGSGPVYLLGGGESAASATALMAALVDGRLALGITLSERRKPYAPGWSRWEVELPAAPEKDRDGFKHCLASLPAAVLGPGEDGT